MSIKLKMAAALVASAMTLPGCTQLQVIKQTWDAAKELTVNRKGVIVATSVFRAAERTGTVYISQKHCPPGVQKPTCMSPPIREQIAVAITTGNDAANQLLDFYEAHPGEIGDQGLYDALKAATASLKGIYAAYNIGAVK